MPRGRKSAEAEKSATGENGTFNFYTIELPVIAGEPMHVPVGVNGETFSLKRGEEIHNVPYRVVEVLRNAIETFYTQREKDNKEGIEMLAGKRLSYPFSVIRGYDRRIEPGAGAVV